MPVKIEKIYDRKIFGDVFISDQIKEKFEILTLEYPRKKIVNQYCLAHFRILLDLYPNDPDSFYKYSKNYLDMSAERKRKQTYESYFDMYGDEKYCREKYNMFLKNTSISLLNAYSTGKRTATYDHFFPQYYIDKGYTEEEANKIVESRKTKANILSIKAKKEDPSSDTTKIEYYLKRGYDLETSKDMLSNRQRTFSKEKCIEKYGVDEGIKRWQDRQNKWLSTLDSKSEDEKKEILRKKLINGKGPVSLQESLLYSLLNVEGSTQQHIIGKYSYDICYGKKIVEFNGDFWHCNPKIYREDFKIYKKTAKQIWEYDKEKIKFAEDSGYDVMIVWENDFNNNRENVIESCRNFLLGR